MVRPVHGHKGRYAWTCDRGDCKLPYELTLEQEELLNPWGASQFVSEPMETDAFQSELDLLHRKFDHAISASFFYGAMVGLTIPLLAMLVSRVFAK